MVSRAVLCNRLLHHRVTNSLPFCAKPLYDGTRALFDSWCEKHEKRYSCDEEKEYRFKIFQKTCARANENNKKNYNTSGLNNFSDMTHDEFLNTYTQRYDPRARGEMIHVRSNAEYNEHIRKSIESKKVVVLYFIKRRKEKKPFTYVVDYVLKCRTNGIFLKIYANELKALADEYAVEDVPTFVFLKGGKEVDRIVGEDPDLMMKMEQHIPMCSERRPQDVFMSSTGYGKVIDCHSKVDYLDHIDESVESKKLVVVYFMKPWCKVCCSVDPKLDKIAKKRTDVKFLKIYTHEFKYLSEHKYAVKDVPMFVLLKEDKEVDRAVGANIEDLEMKIDRHCAATP